MRPARVISAALAAAITACSPQNQSPEDSRAARMTAFEGALLIVGDHRNPIDDSVLLVEGNLIAAAGRRGEVEIPPGAARVDLIGMTLMPAMVDLHSHLGFVDESDGTQSKDNFTRENILDHLDRYAYTGHGATISFGTDFGDLAFRLREESNGPDHRGALLRTVGRGLAWPGSGPAHPARNDVPYPVVSPWQARQAVRELAALNVDFIKIWVDDRNGTRTKITPEIYRAAIDEARQLGIRAAAHVYDLDDAKGLILAGIDGFTHMVRDQPVDEELLEILRERPHVWFTPNLGGPTRRTTPGARADWLADPMLANLMRREEIERWGQAQERSTGPSEMRRWDGHNTSVLHAAGVPLALGSDAAGGTRAYGWSSFFELENFVVDGGMTPHEAIVAATSRAADILDLDHLGTLERGKGADFIVLEANPLDDIRNVRRIVSVYLRGSRVDREGLAAAWRATPPATRAE
jgi:imidazolonepropionase-like amidohydrolase